MDDFNFDSLDLGSRTWSPNYTAIAPPIVGRDKNPPSKRYVIQEKALIMIQCSLDFWSLKNTFNMRIYDIKVYTWQSEVSMNFSRHPHRVYPHSQHSAASVARHCFLNYEGFWCSSRYNNGERGRSKRSASKGKAADRRDSLGKASSEVSALGSSQGSSCSDGDVSVPPSSAPGSERTSGAAGSRAGAKGPKPLPPPRKPHTAETLQARLLKHIRLAPAPLKVRMKRRKRNGT